MSLKKLFWLLCSLSLVMISATGVAEVPSCGEVTGLWNFDNADFTATIGNNLVMVGNQNLNSFGAFGFVAPIAGTTPNVVRVFAYGPGDYLQMYPGIEANGGGQYVNQYTIMLDVLYAERLSLPAALYQTSSNNSNDVECLLSTVEGNDGLGFNGQYDGDVEPGTWYRLGIVVDCVANTMSKYIDGNLVGTQTLDGVDGRWSLYTAAHNQPTLLFTSPHNMQETRELYVNSLAIVGCAMSPEDMASMGAPGQRGLFPPEIPRECATTGLWDFENGNLTATVGTDLGYLGGADQLVQFGTTTQFGIPDIGSSPAHVMYYTNFTVFDGIQMFHGIAANGGGEYVNRYTLILDMLWPATSMDVYRAIFQTYDYNTNDADFFIGDENGIGISGTYDGLIEPDTWYRIAISVDLVDAKMDKYINGVRVGSQTLASGIDGRWSLYPADYAQALLLFTDDDDETAPGYVNSISIISCPLNAAEVATFGGPSADGIGEYSPTAVEEWALY